jgi:hypothetical protein
LEEKVLPLEIPRVDPNEESLLWVFKNDGVEASFAPLPGHSLGVDVPLAEEEELQRGRQVLRSFS